MQNKQNRVLARLLAWAILCCGGTLAQSQTYFDVTVPSGASTTFDTLATFQTATGAGANRETVVRIVTASPPTGVTFQIIPAAGETVVQVTPGGAVASIADSSTNPVASVLAQATAVPTAAGFVILRVSVIYDTAFDFGGAAQTWTLQAARLGAQREYFGFVNTGTNNPATTNDEVDDSVAIPKVKDISDVDFGDVQTNLPDALLPIQTYTIQNVGTGTLNLTGTLEPPGSVFDLQGSVIVTPMEPMQTVSVPVRFRPTTLGTGGANTLAANITSNDPGSPKSVTLKGKGVTLDGIMLLDISGSMGDFPDGSSGASELQSRLWQAKQAGLQLYQEYNELTGGKARFGLYTFPDSVSSAPPPSAGRIVPLNEAALVGGQVSTVMGTIAAGGVKSIGDTPMAKGIEVSQGDLRNADGNYRPLILLLSDGAHNDPKNPPGVPDEWIPTLHNKGIRVYPVGYGTPGSSQMDPALLQRLASGTSGQYWPADSTTFDQLKKGFRSAVKEWLGLNDVVDPPSTIGASQRKMHNVCIDKSARAISFVIDWDKNQRDAINFNLRSPQGATVTAGTNASFFKSDTYAMWVVKGNLVRQGAGAGQWTLDLTGSSQLSGNLNYVYNVQVQSYVNTTPQFAFPFVTGQILQMALPLNGLKPEVLKNAKLVLKYKKPEQSYGTWLATSKVNPAWIVGPSKDPGRPGASLIPSAHAQTTGNDQHAPDIILGEPATLAQKKAWALTNIAKTPFPDKYTEGTVELFDDGTHGDMKAGDGIFSGQGPTFQVDGQYEFNLEVVAQALANDCFQRYFASRNYVAVALNATSVAAETQWKAVEISPYFDATVTKALQTPPGSGIVRRMVVTTPHDDLGNFFGPGHANAVTFQLKNATAVGTPQDLLDGGYAQIVEYASGGNPAVVVTVGDVTSNEVPVPASRWWLWIVILLLLLIILWFILRLMKKHP